MLAGLIVFVIFAAVVVWATWDTWVQAGDVMDEEWMGEDDARRTWRRI